MQSRCINRSQPFLPKEVVFNVANTLDTIKVKGKINNTKRSYNPS